MKNYSAGITNTAKYENKLTQIEPPVFELCLDPFFKPSVFEKYNISSSIFFNNDYPDVLINNTILNIFDEATYHLNEDFQILSYGKDGLEVYLNLGENQVQWTTDKILDFLVKKIKTEFYGNCYVILPLNVVLTPGETLEFFITSSNMSKSEDKIGKMELFFSSKVRILVIFSIIC